MEAYARPIIPWKLDCDANSITRRQLFDMSKRNQKSYEPYNLGLLWGALWTVIFCFGDFTLALLACHMISGCIAIKPFIDRVKYRLNLLDDIQFYNSVTIKALSECSTSPYTLDKGFIDDLK